ncbi:c-type cytochrome [Granulosicoccus antarcticus]|nr:c-type cytochrome [Granulosicoccus antarcticus]
MVSCSVAAEERSGSRCLTTCLLLVSCCLMLTPALVEDTSDTWISDRWEGPALGQPLSDADKLDLPVHVFADGSGLPAGAGTATEGAILYARQCAACHGSQGQGGKAVELVGDRSLLVSEFPDRGIATFWPNAATLFEYVYRSMPPEQPASLSANELYAILAFVLELNDLLAPGDSLDAALLSTIEMPNRQGFRTIAR